MLLILILSIFFIAGICYVVKFFVFKRNEKKIIGGGTFILGPMLIPAYDQKQGYAYQAYNGPVIVSSQPYLMQQEQSYNVPVSNVVHLPPYSSNVKLI